MAMQILTGETLEGRYQLVGKLGGGNFGTVYRARELQNGAAVRDVALKLYSPEATESGDVEGMFADCALPAQVLAGAADESVKRHFVQIFGWGRLRTSIGECAYVAMELVRDAATLEDIIGRHKRTGTPPKSADVLEKMERFFTALYAAHQAGVYHRDIKGANVMLSGAVLKLVDFGMGARMSDGHTPLKTTLSIFAPENFDEEYTVASDLYQAGLLFYEYWTGRQPFDRDTAREVPKQPGESEGEYSQRLMQVLKRWRIDWVYVPGSSIPGVDPSPLLDAVLSKLLLYTPRERFADAKQVLQALVRPTLGAAQGAFASGQPDYADAVAVQLLEEAGTSERDRVELLRLRGDVARQGGQAGAERAKAFYLEANTLAESTGVYFLAKPRHRELLLSVAECCAALGQKGMEQLYIKKAQAIR